MEVKKISWLMVFLVILWTTCITVVNGDESQKPVDVKRKGPKVTHRVSDQSDS